MGTDLYFAPLKPTQPEAGMGAFDSVTRHLSLLQLRARCFFKMGTGRAAFYVESGLLHWLIEGR